MAVFSLKNAEQVRNSLTNNEQRNIRRMYAELYQEVSKQLESAPENSYNAQRLALLQRQINNRIGTLTRNIEQGIISDMGSVAEAVVEDCREFLRQCGFNESDIVDAFQYVPLQIVESIRTGNVYQNGWTLSKAIWWQEGQTRGKINDIIARGTAQGKSAYEVAKDLEKYVNPSARKESRKIEFTNPNTGKKDVFYFGKVDYNAQRLARTLISHAYQQSFEIVNRNDPFVEDYVWHSAGIHGRTCQVCFDRDGKHFKKDELPLDHPNGLCTFEAYIPESMSEIAQRIARWYNAPTGTYPEIDRYAMDFVKP